jgi:hypothetical protein
MGWGWLILFTYLKRLCFKALQRKIIVEMKVGIKGKAPFHGIVRGCARNLLPTGVPRSGEGDKKRGRPRTVSSFLTKTLQQKTADSFKISPYSGGRRAPFF